MERWDEGAVDAIGFVDDQRCGPYAGVPVAFQRFDQAQKAVFELKLNAG